MKFEADILTPTPAYTPIINEEVEPIYSKTQGLRGRIHKTHRRKLGDFISATEGNRGHDPVNESKLSTNYSPALI